MLSRFASRLVKEYVVPDQEEFINYKALVKHLRYSLRQYAKACNEIYYDCHCDVKEVMTIVCHDEIGRMLHLNKDHQLDGLQDKIEIFLRQILPLRN